MEKFLKEKFGEWFNSQAKLKYSLNICIDCLEKSSNYAFEKSVSKKSFFEIENYKEFNMVRNKLLSNKMFKFYDKRNFLAFDKISNYYSRFLKDIKKEINENSNAIFTSSLIDKEEVIAWLITQKNQNGTNYLEHIVRQYMNVLNSSLKKFTTCAPLEIKNMFACRTAEELNSVFNVVKQSINYNEVNRNSSGMFSAGIGCYRRYLEYLEKSQGIDSAQQNISGCIVSAQSENDCEDCVVDWFCKSNYEYTKPYMVNVLNETINVKNWAQVMVGLTKALSEKNKNILEDFAWSGSNRKLFAQNGCELVAPKLISDGVYLETNFNANQIVNYVRALILYCKMDFHGVNIYFRQKDKEAEKLQCKLALDNNEKKEDVFEEDLLVLIKQILLKNFINGYRLNSTIELRRLRKFAQEMNAKVASLADEDIKKYIINVGIISEDKIYVFSDKCKEQLSKIIGDYFASNHLAIFHDEFFKYNERLMIENNIGNEIVMLDVLRSINLPYKFTHNYIGVRDELVSEIVKNEICRVWGREVLQTYDTLKEKLQYIPVSRIKQALGQDGYFVWNRIGEFTNIDMIDISDKDQKELHSKVLYECNKKGYMSIASVELGNIIENNSELTITAIHNGIFQKCLAGDFEKHGKIINKKGCKIDAFNIIKDYCMGVDSCTLEELLLYEKDLTGEVHRWSPMNAAYSEMIRIDKNNFVADKFVNFEIEVVDIELEKNICGDYVSLKNIITFATFPSCGYVWNGFVLESYCKRFSKKFRFETPSVNSKNVGVIIKKSSAITYIEIMVDAIRKSQCKIEKNEILNFLFENGYIGKRTTSDLEEILDRLRSLQ